MLALAVTFLSNLRDFPPDQMKALLLAAQPVSADALRELAVARRSAVKDHPATRELPESPVFGCAGADAPG